MAFRVPDIVTMGSQTRESSFAPFDTLVPVHTTDIDGTDDILAVFDFGTGEGKIWHLWLELSDLDGGITLVFDVDLVDEDGVLVTNLVSASTTGQAGGTIDAVHLGVGGGFVELTGVRYLALRVTTAAGTPQEGTCRVVGFFSPNV